METSLPLQQTRRLGFCKQTSPWPQADLGPGDPAQIYSSRCVASWNCETFRLPHFQTLSTLPDYVESCHASPVLPIGARNCADIVLTPFHSHAGENGVYSAGHSQHA